MKILVTGGCGFIGSHTVDLLLQKGHDVVVIDDLSTGSKEKLDEGITCNRDRVEVRVGSIEDVQLVARSVLEADAVIHLAALVSVGRSIEVPEESFQRNSVGFFNVLNACKQYQRRLVYASSAAVYGAWQGIQDENRGLTTPLSPYAADKCMNDFYAGVFSSLYGFPTIGLRYFNVYGPRQDPKSDYAGVIGKFIDRALSGEAIVIFGDGKQTRNFVHVSDVAKINVAAVLGEERFSEVVNFHHIVNVGCVSGQNSPLGECYSSTPINHLARLIKDATGGKVDIIHGKPASGDIKFSQPNLDQLKYMAPEITSNMIQLEDGIKDLVYYLRDQRIPRLIPKHIVKQFKAYFPVNF